MSRREFLPKVKVVMKVKVDIKILLAARLKLQEKAEQLGVSVKKGKKRYNLG